MGAAERGAVGARLRRGRAAPRCDPRDRGLERGADRRRGRAQGARGAAGGSRDRRERSERPARGAAGGARRLRLRRRVGGRLSSRAACAAHRRARWLLLRVRRGRPAREGIPPPTRSRRQLLDAPPPPLRRAGGRRAGRTLRRLLPEPRPGGQPRLRRSAAIACAPARAVHPPALHGRGVR